jgi:hypothetical protein
LPLCPNRELTANRAGRSLDLHSAYNQKRTLETTDARLLKSVQLSQTRNELAAERPPESFLK